MARHLVRSLLAASFIVAAVCQAAEPEKYALLVGVTKYSHARMNEATLKYPEADAQAVGALLKESGYEVEVLLGPGATQRSVREALARAGKKGNAEGVVLVGLFGHGVQYGEDAYFGTFDTSVRGVQDSQGNVVRDGKGNLKLEPDPATMIDMKSILDSLSLSGAGHKVLLADCCREDPSAARGRAFGSKLKVTELPPGTAALFACSERERAFEHDDWGHGAFTYALLEHARRLATEGDATANDLSIAVFRSVREMVRDKTDGREVQTVNLILTGVVELKLERPRAGPAPSLPKRQPVVMKGEGKELTKQPAAPPQSRSMLGTTAGEVRTLVADPKIDFCWCPPGSFQMGTRGSDQNPGVTATLTKGYWLGRTEVTQQQWIAVCKTEPWSTAAVPAHSDGIGPAYPATNISWAAASAFCGSLTQQEREHGRLPLEWEFALPTEAQWEYACRAGTTSLYSFGDREDSLSRYAWFNSNASDAGEPYVHRVATKLSNQWGLHDMHGNVSELCRDSFAGTLSPVTGGRDPYVAEAEGLLYLSRGGSWRSTHIRCGAYYRVSVVGDKSTSSLGFRLACVPSSEASLTSDPKHLPGQEVAEDSLAMLKGSFSNSAAMNMLLIPAGEFQMGITPEQLVKGAQFDSSFDPKKCLDEQPKHRVQITRPFYLSSHEVTRGEFSSFVSETGYKPESEVTGGQGWNATRGVLDPKLSTDFSWAKTGIDVYGNDHPVVNVTWNDAVAFAKWLSDKESRSYRLPTEAEWEYACRAGTESLYFFGDNPDHFSLHGNARQFKRYLAYRDDYEFTAPIGRFRPNAFGLYDMHGNVNEWCSDWYGADVYRSSNRIDPAGPSTGTSRVVRGGNWWENSAEFCWSADRMSAPPSTRNATTGFRLACDASK